ncbi:MAG: HEAT repeat domain-containing protein [Betaproteobacteria bacterium]
MAVVAVTVGVYAGFRAMVTDRRTAQDYLAEIQSGGSDRRWPAAYELSRLMADPKVRADQTLGPALVTAFKAAAADGDPRVRQYLALAIGRMDPPMPGAAVQALSAALDDADSEARIMTIWALGSSGDANVAPKLQPLYQSDDPGIRKMTVYALGALPGDRQIVTLQTALEDPVADVRWNAAVALARHGNASGVPVIGQMLDRAYVTRRVTREVRQDEDIDPIADVMISGLRATATLRARSLRDTVAALSQRDPSVKVREAALEALKVMG